MHYEHKCQQTLHLHQVPAVDVTILRAAQNVGIFIGQAAVQLIALHLVSRIPE